MNSNPCCPMCYEGRNRKIELRPNARNGNFKCPTCNRDYKRSEICGLYVETIYL